VKIAVPFQIDVRLLALRVMLDYFYTRKSALQP